MTKYKLYTLIICVVVILLLTVIVFSPSFVRDKEPDRTINLSGGVMKYTGEVLYITEHENGYVIYMYLKDYSPTKLMEFWIHDETLLFDDLDGESFRKMLEEHESGRIVKVGCVGAHDNLLDGHTVYPVVFMYDKTPKE